MAEFSIFYSVACIGVFILEVITNISENGSVILYPLIPALTGLAAMLFYRMYLKKERKGTSVLYLNIMFFILATSAEWKFCHVSGFGAWAITLCLNVYILITAFNLVTGSKKSGSLIGYFDWSLILLFFTLLLERTGSLQVISPIHFIVCSLLCGVSLIRTRVSAQNMSKSSSGSTLRVTAVSSLLLAGAAGLAVLTAKPFGAMVISFLIILRNAGLWLLGLIERFLLWLSRFMTPSEGDMGIMEAPQNIPMPGAEEQPLPTNEYLFIAMAVLICLALVVVLVITMKGMRFGRFKVSAAVKGKRSHRTSLISLIIFKIKAAADNIKYRIYLLIYKDTVIGAFLNLERTLKHTPMKRLSGETPEKFLSRCASAAEAMEDAKVSESLRELIIKTNECLYGSSSGCTKFAGAKEIRAWSARRIPKAARNNASH